MSHSGGGPFAPPTAVVFSDGEVATWCLAAPLQPPWAQPPPAAALRGADGRGGLGQRGAGPRPADEVWVFAEPADAREPGSPQSSTAATSRWTAGTRWRAGGGCVRAERTAPEDAACFAAERRCLLGPGADDAGVPVRGGRRRGRPATQKHSDSPLASPASPLTLMKHVRRHGGNPRLRFAAPCRDAELEPGGRGRRDL